jgi:hypothetical protein
MAEDIALTSLRGGMNDTDPALALPEDQCVLAENVEFFHSVLGERRNGCEEFDITGAGLNDEDAIVHISQWFPTNDPTTPQVFVVAASIGTSTSLAVLNGNTWTTVVPIDALTNTSPLVYNVVTQPLHALTALLFVAYASSVDRMHVWNGTILRPAGLAEPVAAPTGANHGAGTFAGTRYYRVRYTEQDTGRTIRRSEPSASLTFSPSGTGDGVTVTRPALLGEGETHWELEASEDNVLFYLIATTAKATTTFVDTVAFGTGYEASGPLSEDIGAYDLLPSAEFLAVEGDRLVLGGHQTDAAKKSTIVWTPVFNDPGVGNSERLPLSVNNTVNLDNGDGGPLTGICASTNGVWYAFKWSKIYQMVRTGDITRAYDVLTLSSTSGAIRGSIFSGVDEAGAACVYFTDPTMGPSRVGAGGVQHIVGLRKTWARVNLHATAVCCRGVYYPYKQQAQWWLAVDGGNVPSLNIKFQVNLGRYQPGGAVGGGLSLSTSRIAQALTVSVITETESDGVNLTIKQRPVIGLTDPDFMQRTDTGSTDNGTGFRAIIRTRPYVVAGLLNRWGAMVAALLATANATARLVVKLIRDSGIENSDEINFDLAAQGDEELVIKDFDDLSMSGARLIQIEFSDPV